MLKLVNVIDLYLSFLDLIATRQFKNRTNFCYVS